MTKEWPERYNITVEIPEKGAFWVPLCCSFSCLKETFSLSPPFAGTSGYSFQNQRVNSHAKNLVAACMILEEQRKEMGGVILSVCTDRGYHLPSVLERIFQVASTRGSARSSWSPRPTTSVTDEGGTETGSAWTGEEKRAGGEREQAGTLQLHLSGGKRSYPRGTAQLLSASPRRIAGWPLPAPDGRSSSIQSHPGAVCSGVDG
jgi:hypothetical protein